MLARPDVIAPEKLRSEWNLAQRLVFRFVFLYSVLYSLFYLLPIPPAVREVVVAPVGATVFGTPAQWHLTGSGDTWFDWVSLFVAASVSMLGMLVWSVFDRRRRSYSRLFAGLLVYLRFVVGAVVLAYGLAKVIQFPTPSPAKLIEPVGSMSPMGLLWTFMGHSMAYKVFAGMMEVVGAGLLFFRRTSLLGALILIGVMANVAMLNLAYDVPVKQFSLHLVAFCALIAVPHARRLLRFFVLDSDRQRRKSLAVAGVVVAGLVVCVEAGLAVMQYAQLSAESSAGPFDGVYDVEELVRNGQVVPPLLSEKTRWRRVGIGAGGFAVRTVDDSGERFAAISNTEGNELTLIDADGQYDLRVTRVEGGLVLEGQLRDAAIRASLREVDGSKLVLPSRGFHWVQEEPFNR